MCYTIPTAGAIVTSFMCSGAKGTRTRWLNLMFWGGALFGIIDHLWNGELFLVSENIVSDLLLGVVISLAIVLVWEVAVVADKLRHPVPVNKGAA